MVELHNTVIKYSCSYILALLNYLTTPVLTHMHTHAIRVGYAAVSLWYQMKAFSEGQCIQTNQELKELYKVLGIAEDIKKKKLEWI